MGSRFTVWETGLGFLGLSQAFGPFFCSILFSGAPWLFLFNGGRESWGLGSIGLNDGV